MNTCAPTISQEIANNLMNCNYKPDLTILNLVSKKNLSKRLKKRKNKNRYDKFNHNFYIKVHHCKL